MTNEIPKAIAKRARGYSWPPFEKGNLAAKTHGARSPRIVTDRAREELQRLVHDFPHLQGFTEELADYSVCAAMASLYREYLDRVGPTTEDGESRASLTKELNRWLLRRAEARTRMGLTPVSAARFPDDRRTLLGRRRELIVEALERIDTEPQRFNNDEEREGMRQSLTKILAKIDGQLADHASRMTGADDGEDE